MRLLYVAHPVGPDGPQRMRNLALARLWLRWLIGKYPDDAFTVPWLPYCEILDETPGNRTRGIRDDLEALRRCDGIVLVGGRLSEGMSHELAEMRMLEREVISHLDLGHLPPGVTDPG